MDLYVFVYASSNVCIDSSIRYYNIIYVYICMDR